jgi:hypothetical protein
LEADFMINVADSDSARLGFGFAGLSFGFSDLGFGFAGQ